jgi:hypothetical protein
MVGVIKITIEERKMVRHTHTLNDITRRRVPPVLYEGKGKGGGITLITPRTVAASAISTP